MGHQKVNTKQKNTELTGQSDLVLVLYNSQWHWSRRWTRSWRHGETKLRHCRQLLHQASTVCCAVVCCSDLKTLHVVLILHCLTDRWHTWSILWLATTVRVRRVSTRKQLLVPRWLRRPRQTIAGDHLSAARLQDQVPWELLSTSWQPWVCQY